MTAAIVVVAAVGLLAAGYWVWRSRDSGTHDQPPFGEPRFTDDAPGRSDR